jgi:DNA-directed RNA polymerase specialized sigma24 family protein
MRRRERRAALERSLLRRHVSGESVPAPAGEAWELVRELPPRQRTVVVLRFVADLTQEEIAGVLRISRSTVASTLADALTRLADLVAVEPELEEHDA